MPWYYYKRGRREGPIDDSAIRRMAALGELEPTDLVWCPGMKDWAQAATVPGLLQPPPVPLQGQPDDEQVFPESSPILPSPVPQPCFASVPTAQRQPYTGSTSELAAAQETIGESGPATTESSTGTASPAAESGSTVFRVHGREPGTAQDTEFLVVAPSHQEATAVAERDGYTVYSVEECVEKPLSARGVPQRMDAASTTGASAPVLASPAGIVAAPRPERQPALDVQAQAEEKRSVRQSSSADKDKNPRRAIPTQTSIPRKGLPKTPRKAYAVALLSGFLLLVLWEVCFGTGSHALLYGRGWFAFVGLAGLLISSILLGWFFGRTYPAVGWRWTFWLGGPTVAVAVFKSVTQGEALKVPAEAFFYLLTLVLLLFSPAGLAGMMGSRKVRSTAVVPPIQGEPEMQFREYNQLPWYRRSGVNSGLILANILSCGFIPSAIVVCINALTGEIYFNKKDKQGNLKTWHWANKVAAVILLLLTMARLVELLVERLGKR